MESGSTVGVGVTVGDATSGVGHGPTTGTIGTTTTGGRSSGRGADGVGVAVAVGVGVAVAVGVGVIAGGVQVHPGPGRRRSAVRNVNVVARMPARVRRTTVSPSIVRRSGAVVTWNSHR